jgi:hypothetical protein
MRGPQHLKTIWFEDEMLPNWAQLLDMAARVTPVSDETRAWFSRLINSSGVDDARTIRDQVETLLRALHANKDAVIAELQRGREDGQAAHIFGAWEYALETILQEASAKKTCSWTVEGVEDTNEGDFGGGDITLRKV